MLDPETGLSHIAPFGLEHQGPQTSKKGIYYANIKLRHFIIKELQDAFPELKQQMATSTNATNMLSAFIALVPLQMKGRLTPDLKKRILKTYKVI